MARCFARRAERGVVLLLALIALLVISAVGAGILYMAAAESGFVGAQQMVARSFYAGMGGLEEGRYRLLPGLQPGAGAVPMGINFTDPLNLIGPGGNPIFACTATEVAGTIAPCNTLTVAAYPVRPWQALYIINTANPAPLAPGTNPNLPAAPNNDPFLLNEIPGALTSTTGSIQPGAGTNASVLWSWVRLNLKTERSAGIDLDLNGSTLDDEPIFSYQGRQYRRADLLIFNPVGDLLPPPWGPLPPATTGRNCIAAVCANPVYLVTAYATMPGRNPTGRIVRSEVTVGTGFSINSGILSEPAIDVSGGSNYIGYDQCDPDCPPGMPDGPTTGMKIDPYLGFTGDPGFIPNCSTVLPVQSNAPVGDSRLTNASARTYPNVCVNTSPGASSSEACVEEAAPFPYNIPEIIDFLRPGATPIAPGNYQNLPDGTTSIGTFPPAPYPASLVSGSGAEAQISYVGGGFKCTAGCTGAGILLIDCPACTAAQPALTLDASMEFYGLIIVNGPVQILGGGTTNSGCNIYGALIAAGTVTTDLGGAMCYRYNSCAQRDLFRNRPLGQLSFREIPE